MLRHSGAGIHLGSVLNTGAVVSTALGRSGTAALSANRDRVANVNLFNGAIQVSAINAEANARQVGNHVVLSNAGSQFIGLRIGGKPRDSYVAPNTRINLVGLGTLWLDRVVTTHRHITVHMIERVLGHATHGRKAGTVIDVANAKAGIRP